MEKNECQVCHEHVNQPRRADVPKNAILCESCFPLFTSQCDRCHRWVATTIVKGGQFLEEAPIVGEGWCHQCAAEHSAVCEFCGANHLVEHLTSSAEGLFCDRCSKRQERVTFGSVLPLTLTNWEDVVSTAVRELPECLHGAVQCQERADDEQLIHIKPGVNGSADKGNEPFAQVTVKRAYLPPSALWPQDASPDVSDEPPAEQFSEWAVLFIVGTTVGLTMLHFDRAYDVDLEQALQLAILGELHELGVVQRDEYGRFVDKHHVQVWP